MTPTKTTLFLWDGENVLQELNAALVRQAQYTDFPGIWGGLASQRRGAGSSYYGFDLQASARQLVSAAQAVTDEYLFKAFGEELLASGTTVNSLRYVVRYGYWRDSAERVYVRARHLLVPQGRWIATDPVGTNAEPAAGYAYNRNEPVRFIDPAGLQRQRPGLPTCKGPVPRRPRGGPVRRDAPAFACYSEVCQAWSRESDLIWEIGFKLCGGSDEGVFAVLLCKAVNFTLPQIGPNEPACPDCWEPGGDPRNWFRDWWSACCVECRMRVCCWIATPRTGVNDSKRDLGLVKCYDYWHGIHWA